MKSGRCLVAMIIVCAADVIVSQLMRLDLMKIMIWWLLVDAPLNMLCLGHAVKILLYFI